MGHNRRYEHIFDELGRRRIEEVAIRPQPVSLSDDELDVERHPVRRGREPLPVRAWVRYPETVVDVRAEAIEWTDRAVHLRWIAPDGSRRQAWVWASAVRRIEPGLDGKIDVRDRDLSAHVRRPVTGPADDA